MVGFFKMFGAPPKVVSYYKATDKTEKAKLETLYKLYDGFVKEESVEMERQEEMFRINNIRYDRKFNEWLILNSAFERIYQFGLNNGYPEHLLILFYVEKPEPTDF